MLQKLKESGWFGTAVASAAGVVGLVASVVGLWVMFQGTVKDSVTAGMETITLEVRRTNRDVIGVFADDLHTRKRVLDREIEAMESSGLLDTEGQLMLQRKRSHRDDMMHQIKEIETKWPNSNF